MIKGQKRETFKITSSRLSIQSSGLVCVPLPLAAEATSRYIPPKWRVYLARDMHDGCKTHSELMGLCREKMESLWESALCVSLVGLVQQLLVGRKQFRLGGKTTTSTYCLLVYSSKKKREKKNSRTGRKTCHCTHFAVAASVSFALREKKNCVHGKESYVLLIPRWGDIIF